jgi:hypothetical protein
MPDFKLYYRATVIKMAYTSPKTDTKASGIEDPDTNPHGLQSSDF